MNYTTVTDAERMLQLWCPKISGYVKQIRGNLAYDEKINIHWWINNLWYVEVEGTREGWEYPEEIRAWLTVDIKKDVVIFNNSNAEGFGGNCGARTIKWKRILYKMFEEECNRHTRPKLFHFYRNIYLDKGGE